MLGLHSCQSAQEDSAAVRMLPGSTSSLQVNRIVLSLPMKSAFPPSLAPQLLSFHIVSRPLQLNSFVFTSLQETCPRGVCARHSSLFALSREGSIPTQLKGPFGTSSKLSPIIATLTKKHPGYRGLHLQNPVREKWGTSQVSRNGNTGSPQGCPGARFGGRPLQKPALLTELPLRSFVPLRESHRGLDAPPDAFGRRGASTRPLRPRTGGGYPHEIVLCTIQPG